MKKLFLIIPIIAVISLTGCYNKKVQEEQLLRLNPTSTVQVQIDNSGDANQSATTAKAQIDTYGDTKLFGSKALGWEIKFSESHNKVDCADCIGGLYLLFGPLKPVMSVTPTTEKAPAYTLAFSEAKSLSNEYNLVKANATMPETVTKKKIGNFDVITWKDGGECENRMLEIIGTKYNVVMSSLGCSTTEQEDFKYFEDMVNNLKKLD